MKGRIMAYRGSHHTQRPKQIIVKVEGVSDKSAAVKLHGKKAVWTTPSGKKITGIITQPHGNKGYVRVRFPEKGLPGQALGTEIEIE